MTEVTPFWMKRHFRNRHVRGYGKQQASRRNDKPLTKITRCSCIMWVVGPKARMSWENFPVLDELTRPSWNTQLDRNRDGQVD
jgi:hypothetical protein